MRLIGNGHSAALKVRAIVPSPKFPRNLGQAEAQPTQLYSALPIKDFLGTPQKCSLLPGVLHPSTHSLPDHLPFKLRHGCQDVEHQPGCGIALIGVDVLRDREEPHTMRSQVFDSVTAVPH